MARILLACGASVALYKACDLVSKLAQDGHQVRTILTPRAARLIKPQLFEALTGEPAASDEGSPTRRTAMDHIDLARWAECFVVAPCSADLAGRLALGLGGDLVTTTALALPPEVPRVVCPAMNPAMLENKAVARNLKQLALDGWTIVEPDAGHMACGMSGKGRLADPLRIASTIAACLAR